jgi:MFS transporter, ACS family, D-galactonate transporter
MTCLGIVVLATVVLYHQFFLIGAVSTRVMAEFHISFTAYGAITVGPVTSAIDLWVAGLVWRAPRADAHNGGLLLSVAPLMGAVVLAESRYQFRPAPCS